MRGKVLLGCCMLLPNPTTSCDNQRIDVGKAAEQVVARDHVCANKVIGREFALRGRARKAERALEQACLARFGTLRPADPTPVPRSDNGLIFQSKRFRAACREYRLAQEFITP
jgi:putative transposase